jgi:hypothetical protein
LRYSGDGLLRISRYVKHHTGMEVIWYVGANDHRTLRQRDIPFWRKLSCQEDGL